MGGIESASAFQFESYKVDSVHLEMKRVVGLLEFRGCIDPDKIKIGIGISQPTYLKNQKRYLGGISLNLVVFPPDATEPVGDGDVLLKIDLSVVGLFKVTEERFSESTEENLVKLQIPAILLPYARATLSSLMANAGFGSVVLPLINVHELARDANLTIKVVE